MLRNYSVSLAVGILAGLIYAALNVNSPAPPIIALVGLLGMLIGEHAIPFIKRAIQFYTAKLGCLRYKSHQKNVEYRSPPHKKPSEEGIKKTD